MESMCFCIRHPLLIHHLQTYTNPVWIDSWWWVTAVQLLNFVCVGYVFPYYSRETQQMELSIALLPYPKSLHRESSSVPGGESRCCVAASAQVPAAGGPWWSRVTASPPASPVFSSTVTRSSEIDQKMFQGKKKWEICSFWPGEVIWWVGTREEREVFVSPGSSDLWNAFIAVSFARWKGGAQWGPSPCPEGRKGWESSMCWAGKLLLSVPGGWGWRWASDRAAPSCKWGWGEAWSRERLFADMFIVC